MVVLGENLETRLVEILKVPLKGIVSALSPVVKIGREFVPVLLIQ